MGPGEPGAHLFVFQKETNIAVADQSLLDGRTHRPVANNMTVAALAASMGFPVVLYLLVDVSSAA